MTIGRRCSSCLLRTPLVLSTDMGITLCYNGQAVACVVCRQFRRARHPACWMYLFRVSGNFAVARHAFACHVILPHKLLPSRLI